MKSLLDKVVEKSKAFGHIALREDSNSKHETDDEAILAILDSHIALGEHMQLEHDKEIARLRGELHEPN